MACGKHKSPPAVDLQDNDGDQIINEYERNEFEKNVASITTIDEIRGVLRFTDDQIVEIPISNLSNTHQNSMKLLVSDEKNLPFENYFSEWKKLRFLKKIDLKDFKHKSYTLYLNFEQNQIKPDELHLITNDQSRYLGPWSTEMKIILNNIELASLISGESFLSLEKKFFHQEYFPIDSSQTIQQNTYRLFYKDQKNARVLYISKKYPIDKFLNASSITNYINLDETELFFMKISNEANRWFLKNLPNGDKVVLFSSSKNIHAEFLNHFNQKKTTLFRSNGHPSSLFKLENSGDANIYLKIRATKMVRTFTERILKKDYKEGGGGVNGNGGFRWSCSHYFRDIATETSIIPSFREVLDEMVLSSNGGVISLVEGPDLITQEEMDEKGPYLLLKIKQPHEKIQISLKSRAESTFVTTGQYRAHCDKGNSGSRHAAYQTNEEGNLNIQIESYVEKI